MSNTNVTCSTNAPASATTQYFLADVNLTDYEARVRATSGPDSPQFEIRIAFAMPLELAPITRTIVFFNVTELTKRSKPRWADIVKIGGAGGGDFVLHLLVTRVTNEEEGSVWPFIGTDDIVVETWRNPSATDQPFLLHATFTEIEVVDTEEVISDSASSSSEDLSPPSPFERIAAPEAPMIGAWNHVGSSLDLTFGLEGNADADAAATVPDTQPPPSTPKAPRLRPSPPPARRTRAPRPKTIRVSAADLDRWMESREEVPVSPVKSDDEGAQYSGPVSPISETGSTHTGNPFIDSHAIHSSDESGESSDDSNITNVFTGMRDIGRHLPDPRIEDPVPRRPNTPDPRVDFPSTPSPRVETPTGPRPAPREASGRTPNPGLARAHTVLDTSRFGPRPNRATTDMMGRPTTGTPTTPIPLDHNRVERMASNGAGRHYERDARPATSTDATGHYPSGSGASKRGTSFKDKFGGLFGRKKR
jgi:hypothetical protein